MIVTTVGEVLGKYNSCELKCPMRGTVVRKLTRLTDGIEIDYFSGKVVVPAHTPLIFEPWVMDRGSMLFDLPDMPRAKFCTEFDVIVYPDGTSVPVEHD
jgi:hypothetical protein